MVKTSWFERSRGADVRTLGAIAVTATLALGWAHRWMSDDGYITLRVANQFAHGHGFVFNVGERIEASTSPLWTLGLGLAAVLTPFPLQWIAVVLGLACMAGAVGFGVAGSARWLAVRQPDRTSNGVWPMGVLFLLGVPYVWDFTTSGLDIAPALLWLAVCWWWLARVSDGHAFEATRPLLVVLGLGTLIRPEFAVVSAVLLAVVIRHSSGPRRIFRSLTYAGLLPLAYEIFRMGYFAALVPNTALAKEGSLPRLDGVGIAYLGLFVAKTALPVPFLLLLRPAARKVLAADATSAEREVAVGFVIAGTVLASYVVLVGGDFMMGRLLLPSLMCFVLPVFLVPHSPDAIRAFGPPLIAWVLIAAFLTPTLIDREGARWGQRVVDERRYYIADYFNNPHPITYQLDKWSPAAVRTLEQQVGPTGYLLDEYPTPQAPVPFRPGTTDRPNAHYTFRIGVLGYLLPLGMYIADAKGLADPVVAREKLTVRDRPGHEKFQPFEYYAARLGQTAGAPSPECRDIADLTAAVSKPLTVSRFFQNMTHALHFTRVRFDASLIGRCAGASQH